MGYLASEMIGLSGIISLLVCGIFLAQYGWYNLSPQSKCGTRYELTFII
jgi:NhaP-type Na+/H+ or K+/H+ antiporter